VPDSPQTIQAEPKAGSTGLMAFLGIPAVDKTIAIVACVPFVYALYRRLAEGSLTLPGAAAAIGQLITIATMILRRAPQRITPNPWWWLLAFVATYGSLGWGVFAPPGIPLVPRLVTTTLSLLGLAVVVYARLSLGRNIGFVPAQRTLVSSGAYRYVRHPIYSGLFLTWLSLCLRQYSSLNLGLFLTICLLYFIKSLVEEGFLRHDPAYAAYLGQVRSRYFPGLF
jgi:protein-S-isoprenylcysteine O-methyltransferase Ste14